MGRLTPAAEATPSMVRSAYHFLDQDRRGGLEIGQADTAESALLHIPSLATVVTGDLAYEVHTMTAETARAERAAVAALERNLVAGHKKVENDNDPKIIGESQQYLRDSQRA